MKIANFTTTTSVCVTLSEAERQWIVFALRYLAGDSNKDERNRCKRMVAQLERARRDN